MQPAQIANQLLQKNGTGIIPRTLSLNLEPSLLSKKNTNVNIAELSEKIIVCVDDNFVNLNSIKLMLEMIGFRGQVKCF